MSAYHSVVEQVWYRMQRGFHCLCDEGNGLVAVQPRAYKVTTIRGEGDTYPSDLIARDFTSSIPGMRLVGDITYLHTGEGWLYLATVIDLATQAFSVRTYPYHFYRARFNNGNRLVRQYSQAIDWVGGSFHELILGKPFADILVEDRAIRSDTSFSGNDFPRCCSNSQTTLASSSPIPQILTSTLSQGINKFNWCQVS